MKKRIFNIIVGLLFTLLAVLLFEHETVESVNQFYSGYGFLKFILILFYYLIGQIGTIIFFFGVGVFLLLVGVFNLNLKRKKKKK
mgnify:CR=1 FL=1